MGTLKAGLLYFCLVFAAGWVLGPIRELWVIPCLGRTVGILLEAPAMLVIMIAAARWTVQRLNVASTLPARAATGFIALGLLLWSLRRCRC
jgi:hypothetical protein